MVQGAVVIQEKVRIPAGVFDLESFRRWIHSGDFPEYGRISFLAGEVDVDMSPEELETHNKVKGDAQGDIRSWVRTHDSGEVLFDGALLVNEAAALSTEPNLMFCSWETLESGRAEFREVVEGSERYLEVTGSPDLTVEVVSTTSIRKDTSILPKLYYAAGVREYWVIDARGREIDFTVFHRGADSYAATAPDEQGFLRSEALSAEVKLVRERNRRGTFRYTLLLRPVP